MPRALMGSWYILFRKLYISYYERIIIIRGESIMLEMAVFAVVFVIAQIISGLLIMKLMTSERFMKYYTKKSIKLVKDVTDYYEELLFEED
jgi:hypothetical protein